MYHMHVKETTSDEVAAAILETIPRSMHSIREHMRSGRPAGLPVSQFRALLFLRRNPGARLSALSTHLGMSRPSGSQMADRLVAAGLMTRSQHPADSRALALHLTEAGAAALEKCDEQTRAWLCGRMSGLDNQRLAAIADALRDLSAALGDEGPPQ